MKGLYKKRDLNSLYSIKQYVIKNVKNEKERLFLKLALSQTLKIISKFPISSPYISRNRNNKIRKEAFSVLKIL